VIFLTETFDPIKMASQDYRAIYFEAFCHQSISFFDQPSNSPGILAAKLSTDPESIHSFAGGNLSVLITVGVALVSTIALSLAVGWKLGLVVLAGGLPFIFAASYIREHMEQTFEENAARVFNDCVGYATECIQGIRTVVSLNMEGEVERRFGGLLDEHAVRARKYALRAMVWFALSESIELLAMALAFW
jgi:ATP-binding cassette subfamily B (MDR/TAP) protein 1